MSRRPTIDLKNLDGIWKTFYGRRIALHADADAAVLEIWRDRAPKVDALVQVARVALGETVAPVDPETAAAAATSLSLVRNDTELADVIALWIRRAQAEGTTGALGLAADAANVAVGFDWDLAFEDAYAALLDLDAINAKALATLDAAISATARDMGRALGPLVQAGASYDELVTAVEDVFANADAASYWVDTAMSASMSQGALDLYASEGVTTVNWLTAGDDRVCAECEGDEEGNPWPLDGSMPVPPQHGKCRCTLTANSDIPASAYDKYLSGAEIE